jgi:hypothetical protein
VLEAEIAQAAHQPVARGQQLAARPAAFRRVDEGERVGISLRVAPESVFSHGVFLRRSKVPEVHAEMGRAPLL